MGHPTASCPVAGSIALSNMEERLSAGVSRVQSGNQKKGTVGSLDRLRKKIFSYK